MIGVTPVISHVAGSATFTAKSGDANLDGIVDLTDRNILQQGSGTRWQDGDFVDDDVLDILDYRARADGAGVPEPTSAALYLMGTLLCGVSLGDRRGRPPNSTPSIGKA